MQSRGTPVPIFREKDTLWGMTRYPNAAPWRQTLARKFTFLKTHQNALALVALAALTLITFSQLTFQFPWLIWGPSSSAAVDLQFYFKWTHQWFSDINIYAGVRPEGYPPASILLLYPLTGWLDLTPTRWLWGGFTIITLLLLCLLIIRVSDAKTWRDRIWLALIVLANNGVGVTVGNGQSTIPIVLLLLLAVLLLHTRPPTWRNDLLVAACYIGGSLKPNLSAPFFWLLLILPTGIRFRPLVLAAVGYLGLTLLAAQFVSTPLWELLQDLARNSATYIGAARDPNLQYVLVKLGLTPIALPISIGIWFALGVWIWRYRKADLWILLAVTTLVVRFWSYHRAYDNLFIVIPEIALWRMIHFQTKTRGSNSVAAVLLAVNVLVTIAIISTAPLSGWLAILIQAAQGITWSVTLFYFLVITYRQNSSNAEQLSFSDAGKVRMPTGMPQDDAMV